MSEDQINQLETNQSKIRGILNVIIDNMVNNAEIRAKIEDDNSTAGFLE